MANETLDLGDSGIGRGVFEMMGLKMSIAIILLVAAVGWVVRFVNYRRESQKLSLNLPAPPFSILLGNLGAMGKIYTHAPTNTHPHGIFTMLAREYNLRGLFYMDTWPASSKRLLAIIDPGLAAQVTQVNSLPKDPGTEVHIGHITGPQSLIYTEGDKWKKTRSLFNPGFSLAHLMTLVPTIVDDTAVYCKVLAEHAESGEVHPIEGDLAHLTIDIMGHVVLDHDLDAQTEENELVEAFRKQISWTPSPVSTNPFVGFNPMRPFMQRYYTRKMNNYLGRVIDSRFAMKKAESSLNSSKRKPAIDLALDEYTRQQSSEIPGSKPSSTTGVDAAFKEICIDQMKSFIFAGHDTSSSTLAYAYLLLSKNPDKLAKARTELDAVFGPNTSPTQVGDHIKATPTLTNSLPYLVSVIRETLRLFPPALTARKGMGYLTFEGNTYNINNTLLMVLSHTLHHNADYFPSPDQFIPERFLPSPDNFQDIPKDAFRPFEKGPRDCIGQQLAMLEMKIILAMTLREWDFVEDYVAWDTRLGRAKPGDILDGRRGMFGMRAYQQLVATAKPIDGLPGRWVKR